MLRNYLKTGTRNLAKNKGYALINILGLSIGIAACILIFVVLRFETSFDTFHTKKDHIYRIGTAFSGQDGVSYSSGVSFPVAPALRVDFPQIKEVASIFKKGDVQVTAEQTGDRTKKFHEGAFFYAEPSFFNMFDFGWLAGNPKASLTNPDYVVLTQEIAEKYFGTWQAAIGKNIKLDNQYTYKVSGILKNVPLNTDFPLTAVASFSSLMNTNMKRSMNDWVSTMSDASIFVVLPSGYSIPKFNQELRDFAKRHRPVEYSNDALIAQPLNEIHYDDRFGNFRSHTFSKSLIRALILIGVFLLVIACVNFVNLATAQAVNRSREVGVRKVLGSTRKQLSFQFMIETTFITLISVISGTIIASAALPLLNNLLEVKMTLNLFSDATMFLFLIGVTIVVSFLSGLYPSVILSGFNPITALKSKVTSKMMGGITLRRVLVVMQFAIAHILIIGTIIVVSQMNFFHNAALGFEKTAIVNVPIPGDSISRTRIDYMKDKLAANPDISSFSFSFASPSADGNWSSDFKFDHSTKSTQFGANLKWADVNYFKTYNLQFVAGRSYYPSDTVREFVVNEKLL
ncbi:MAG: ABC transporter permease, partial [Flavisolibacter sp.]